MVSFNLKKLDSKLSNTSILSSIRTLLNIAIHGQYDLFRVP